MKLSRRSPARPPLALALFLVPLLAEAPSGHARQDGPAESPAPAAAADPRAELAIVDPTPDIVFAQAIWDVRSGATTAALAKLDAAAAASDDAAFDERVKREKERVLAWCDLRDRYLGYLLEDGKKLTLERAGSKHKLTLSGIADGEITFAKNKGKIERLAVEAVDPNALAQQMGKKAAELAPAPWVRLYPYVLAENAKWKKLLKGETPAGEALLADANDDYPARLRTGRAAASLDALARTSVPASAEEADALLARIGELRSALGELPLVSTRAGALRAVAAEAHGVRFESQGVPSLLKGAYEDLGDGRVKIHYDFDEPEELGGLGPRSTT